MKAAPPVPITLDNLNGDRCTLEVGSEAGLLDGGIYMFQVRVGDGCRWSHWSHLSNAFVFRVPPPTPPNAAAIGNQQPVTVEIVSSTVARVRWCDFRPAPGLTLLEYEVRAAPQQLTQNKHGSAAISVSYDHKYRGGWIEREVPNLLPFTQYVFSIQVRYPKVGGRAFTGMQSSEPVTLEHPMAAQDPPTPFACPDVGEEEEDPVGGKADAQQTQVAVQNQKPAGAGADGGVRFATVAFPDEEDGAHYDLEYAHVLGEEQDTSELRTSQVLWHSPTEVSISDCGTNLNSDELPRWRIRLPDLRAFRSEPLKLALLQRVRFRLRARFTSEAPTTRWWSSLSAPVVTGFAGPDGAAAALVAACDRLALEIQFSLDRRLADAVTAAGVVPMRVHRAELDKALQEKKEPTTERMTGMPNSSTSGQPTWPRGFGHPFVTRYQLRVRYQKKKGDELAGGAAAPGSAEAGGEKEKDSAEKEKDWGSWEVHADSALPLLQDRGNAGGGWGASQQRATNPQARWYSCEVPQMRGRALTPGDVVQTAIRVGDGTKWSAWRGVKEVTVAIPPPRQAREIDAARAEWIADKCTVSWPVAAGPIGLDSIEYQLMVEPDSANLPPRIGAVLINAAATGGRREEATTSGPGALAIAERPQGRKLSVQGPAAKHAKAGTGMVASSSERPAGSRKLSTSAERRKSREDNPSGEEWPQQSGEKEQVPHAPSGKTATEAGRGTARPAAGVRGSQRTGELNAPGVEGEEKSSQAMVSVDLRDLCTDLRYGFTINARYPTVGPRVWTKIFEVPKVSWRPTIACPAVSLSRGLAADGSKRAPAPPIPEQRPAPEDGRLKRWYDSRFVLLAWPGLEVAEEGTAAILQKYELQASEAPPPLDVPVPTTAADDAALEESRAWWPCKNLKPLKLDGVPCIAVRDLPFLVGQFRLFDASQQQAGPPSRLMVSIYEVLNPAPVAELQALGKIAPRTLAFNLKVSLAAPGGTQKRATLRQVRFKPIGSGTDGRWEELEPAPLDSSQGSEVSMLVREEDGLELGPTYEFCVRVGDNARLGPWSEPSKPHKFAVPPPEPATHGGIKVAVEADSVQLSWPAFQPEAVLALRMPGFANLPIEYTVGVYGGATDDPVATFVTRETQTIVRALAPGAAYSAVLSARWARFGAVGPSGSSVEERKKTSLMAAFVTSHAAKKVVAEHLRGPHDKEEPVIPRSPMEGTGQSAARLDLDPSYDSVQAPHQSPQFARKPMPQSLQSPSARVAPSPRNIVTAPAYPSAQAPSRFLPADSSEGGGQQRSEEQDAPLCGRHLLPTLVPMPPPKFTNRDPLSFAPLIDMTASPSRGPHRRAKSPRDVASTR